MIVPIACGACGACRAVQAENGASAFYSRTSSLAQQLVADIQQAGGIITADDLHNYLHNGTVKVHTSHFTLLYTTLNAHARTTQHNTTQHNTTQRNATQHNTTHKCRCEGR
jgi:imidazole glycerol phosphate synthase subunit HisF